MTEETLNGYCVKCKASRPMKDAEAVYMANGRPATRGICSVCGTGLFKIGMTAAHASVPKPELKPAGGTSRTRRGEAGREKRRAVVSSGGHNGSLVIVESPAKARTIGRFLGRGYDVRASIGHVRDLLRSKLSVDLEHDFQPTYRVPDDKKDVVKTLKAAALQASQVYLATDPDREGEAIAWHLAEAVGVPTERAKRVVFHEITENAIREAFAHSRDIDMRLVDAQQARRILDRLVGYQVSPLLWENVRSRLSAGRVQSVALRLIVEREREIAAFVPLEYWSVDAELAQQVTRGALARRSFLARLIRIRGEDADLKKRNDADRIVGELEGASYSVASVKRGERRRRPNPPFTTSTLQQDAAQRLGMTAARTMRVAQELYEGIEAGGADGPVGLITYMRTDSVIVAREAQAEAKSLIIETYGSEYAPPEPNVYRARAKNAQEAHEAIRPTSCHRLPATLRDRLTRDQHRLYELIWQRFIASQMAAAIYDTMTVDVAAGGPGQDPQPYLFRARGSRVRFPGFLIVYSGGAPGPANGKQESTLDSQNRLTEGAEAEGRQESTLYPKEGAAGSPSAAPQRPTEENSAGSLAQQDELAEQEVLPDLKQGEVLDLLRLLPEQHFTQPPPRYTEASLVKGLEENGIGRPSTYAVIISTVLDRGYVAREDRKLLPTDLGFTVNDLLVKHFDTVFNVGFTADMEEQLDRISTGQEQMVPVLRAFYDFFEPQLRNAAHTMEKVVVEPQKTGETCPLCGGDLIVKAGRFGAFVGCSTYPQCRFTKPLVAKIGVSCPKDGGEIVERRTKQGRNFYGCANYPGCDFTSWKRPIPQRCDSCGGLMVLAGTGKYTVSKGEAECTVCHTRQKI